MNSHVVYSFGAFRLDPVARKLWRNGQVLSPQLKVFDCIVFLVEHRDRAIGRDELIEAIWGHAHLADNTLGQVIRRARRVLGDSGNDQNAIETVRGFGYQWTAPVEVVEVQEEAAVSADPPAPLVSDTGFRSAGVRAWLAALTVAAIVIAVTLYLWPDSGTRVAGVSASIAGKNEVALLLPVVVESEAEHAWARLGLMDVITERLRAAGQAMVSTDTVIALLHGAEQPPDTKVLDRLTTTTDAGLVLEAAASLSETQWRVTLRSVDNSSLPVAAVGEGRDILQAARAAADAMASRLGLTPTDAEPETEPGMRLLLRQIEAARLAQQLDTARALIEDTDPHLRQHPEIRFQLATLDYFSDNLDAAYATFEALLEETPAERDGEFRARILNALGGVHFRRRESAAAEAALEEAGRLVNEDDAPAIYSTIWHSLGVVALSQGKFDAARRNMTRARRGYNNAGDIKKLATLDLNRGVLEAVREHPAKALRYFTESADTLAALRDSGAELLVRINMVEANLAMLELRAASEIMPRLDELIAQAKNPTLVTDARLAKVALLEASGQYREAEDLVTDILQATRNSDIQRSTWMSARVFLTERHLRQGDADEAVRIAGEIASLNASHGSYLSGDRLGRAWLTLVRGYLARQNLAEAREAVNGFTEWTESSKTLPPKIYAAIARAELAAFDDSAKAAGDAYEQVLALAQTSDAPLRLLQVAESYVPWLLSKENPDPDRALLVAELVERYTEQHFGAALLELRVYHATSTSSAWRTALARAQALAGEREIPQALLSAP